MNNEKELDVRYVSELRQNMNKITVSIGKLYKDIDDGIADIEAGRVSDFSEFAKQLRKETEKETC